MIATESAAASSRRTPVVAAVVAASDRLDRAGGRRAERRGPDRPACRADCSVQTSHTHQPIDRACCLPGSTGAPRVAERCLGRLDHRHDVAGELAAALGASPPVAIALQEVGDLDRDRLGVVQPRARRCRRCGRRAGTRRRSRGPRRSTPVVEDPHGSGLAVVVDDHLLAADDHRPAQLARREPAQLDVRQQRRRGSAGHERDVGDARHDRVAADGASPTPAVSPSQ